MGRRKAHLLTSRYWDMGLPMPSLVSVYMPDCVQLSLTTGAGVVKEIKNSARKHEALNQIVFYVMI